MQITITSMTNFFFLNTSTFRPRDTQQAENMLCMWEVWVQSLTPGGTQVLPTITPEH